MIGYNDYWVLLFQVYSYQYSLYIGGKVPPPL